MHYCICQLQGNSSVSTHSATRYDLPFSCHNCDNIECTAARTTERQPFTLRILCSLRPISWIMMSSRVCRSWTSRTISTFTARQISNTHSQNGLLKELCGMQQLCYMHASAVEPIIPAVPSSCFHTRSTVCQVSEATPKCVARDDGHDPMAYSAHSQPPVF